MIHFFKYILTFVLAFSISIVFAQREINPEKVEKLQSKKLIFLWPGMNCPAFKNTYDVYGFKIVCAGSINTTTLNKNNKKVVKTVNRTYGKDWFNQNVKSFIQKDN